MPHRHAKNLKSTSYRFGIDFQTVGTVPDDAKSRLDYFTAFKELLKGERDKIKVWHRSGAGGREVIQAQTGLIDEVIKHITSSLLALKRYESVPALDEFSLVAVGGYGRGELNPCSDIDLLFVLKDNIKPLTDQFIQELISIFWGMGMEIGHSCRTVKDCVKLAKTDITIKTSMLGTRYLVGDQDLFEALRHAINTAVMKKDTREFLESKLKEKFAHHGLAEGVSCHAEPDIKNGPGGLRDYHVALWAVAVCFGTLSFREIGRDDVISDHELDSLEQAVDFLLRVRNELHYLMNKKCDVLTLDIQKELAVNLQYVEKNGVPQVELFMHDYFFHATHINDFCEMIFDKCRDSKHSIKKVISTLKTRDLGKGFCARDSMLMFREKPGTIFRDNKMLLLDVFELCRDHNIDLDSTVKRQIRLHLDLIDPAFLREPKVKEFLLALLNHPKSEKVLHIMHEAGVLGKILPEFGQTHCMVYYDFYHRYTADEHSLRMVRFLEGLEGDREIGELSVLSEGVCGRGSKSGWRLKLAALLSSLRNQREGEEPQKTWDVLLPVFQRLQLTPDEAETVHFLIENLYEMMETAFHQDIHQPAVVKGFVQKVHSLERLNQLYLMSYAELRAVAPDTWTAWKKNLLSEFYHRTRNYLERPESLAQKPNDTLEEVYRVMEGEFSRADIEHHLSMMPDDYLVTTYPGEVALHLRIVRELAVPRTFVAQHSYNTVGGFYNLVLCCPNKVETFKKIVGAMTAKNLNILGAQIYLRKDDIVIFTIQAEGAEGVDLSAPKVWTDLENNLHEVLDDCKDLATLFKTRMRYAQKKRPLPIVPKIQIDNTPASAYTVLRIEARDHLGMLYKIAKVLADLDIQIHRAKISCMGGRGIDVFYVSQRGQKIVFDRLIRRTKENLINILLIEKMEDIG
jgi:[protein-PII] uridylyltransferase